MIIAPPDLPGRTAGSPKSEPLGMDIRPRVQYHSDVDYAWFFVLVGATLGAVLVIWVLPGRRPKYLLTFCVFIAAAVLLWVVFGSGLWSCVALGLAAFTAAAKVEARKSRRPSAG